jgi:glycosyltransferase involved in cell wall biosynthesis
LTSTWNRRVTLSCTYLSLLDSTYKDFAWLIYNDGSIDETHEYVLSLLEASPFKITYLNSPIRLGKCVADNALISSSKSEFVLWLDSDDIILPDTLEKAVTAWDSTDKLSCHSFIGVGARVTNGLLANPPYKSCKPESFPITISYSDFCDYAHGDGFMLIHRDFYKHVHFPELDYMVTESCAWHPILNNNKIIYLDESLKLMNRSTPNSLSFGRHMSYCYGRAFSLSVFLSLSPGTNPTFRQYITFLRYCMHCSMRPIHDTTFYLSRRIALLNPAMRILILLSARILYFYDVLTKDCGNNEGIPASGQLIAAKSRLETYTCLGSTL